MMNDVTVFIYFICFAAVSGATFAYMWQIMGSTLREFDKPTKKSYNKHPEMDEVKDGDELLVFKASPNDEED